LNSLEDADASFRLYISDSNPALPNRLIGLRPSELKEELTIRIEETDLRSSLALLTCLEASFRIDYLQRCQKRRRDSVSKALRVLHKQHGQHVRLEDDILATWRREHPELGSLIGELVGAFKFRHWLAHGRYWRPKHGRKYDYQSIYGLAVSILASFQLHARDV
jgi:hypothetical protein